MDRSLLLAFVVLFVIVFVLPRVGTISGAEARRLVGAGAILVDVRSAREVAAGHIPGARHIPLDELMSHVDELRAAQKPVIVYCASGARSAAAKRALKGAGLSDVHNLGAMRRW